MQEVTIKCTKEFLKFANSLFSLVTYYIYSVYAGAPSILPLIINLITFLVFWQDAKYYVTSH